MIRAARQLVALALIAFASTACGLKQLPFPDPHYEGEYGKALKKWTRKVALYSGLETRAFVRVVYLSPEFVTAQAAELARMRAELPDQAAETLARMREEYRAPSFFAVVYIPDRGANDWNEPDSVWRLALNEGLGEVAPDRVVRYDVPFNAEMKRLYPFLDEYSVAYLIRFPDPEAPKYEANATTAQGVPMAAPPSPGHYHPAEADLIVAGALGKMVFHWRLDGGVEQEPEATGAPPARPESPKTP